MENYTDSINSTEKLHTPNKDSANEIGVINNALELQKAAVAKQVADWDIFREGTNFFVNNRGEITFISIFLLDDPLNLNFLKTVELGSLKKLIIVSKDVVSVDFLSHFDSLEDVFIATNCEVSLDGFDKLISITELNISSPKQSNLTPLARLTNLKNIDICVDNESALLPLARLDKLESLDLSGSTINSLELFGENFKSLVKLNLSDCKINEIPESFIDLNFDVYLEEGIDFHFLESNKNKLVNFYDNNVTIPPKEIVKQGNLVMKKYYQSLQGETSKLNEAKLVLVGEGAAGKTSLINRFNENKFNPREDKTDGISITPWKVNVDKEDVTLHCWDFGGQEIMRATHQLFLSERSIYVIVLDGRKDENPEHWLKQVLAVSKSSPILIVLNKSDEHYDDNIRRQHLKEKYSNIIGFYKTSCKSGVGITKLKHIIKAEVAKLEMRNFVLAKNWLAIKDDLEELKKESDHISHQDFTKICTNHSIEDHQVQNILLTLLNDLGHIIHFKELHELQTQVLNPTWITEGIYTLLNSDKLAKNDGVITVTEAEKILEEKLDFSRYRGKSTFLMQVMEQFELCYSIDAKRNNKKFLVPDLLPTELTRNPTIDNGIEFIYKYNDYMPPELMARFIVKSHIHQVPKKCWRFGVLLKHKAFKSSALITQDKEDRIIKIKVDGAERRSFLAVLRSYFSEIHSSYKAENIGLEELLPLKCIETNKESYLPYERLIKIEQRLLKGIGSDSQYDHVLNIDYSVAKILDGIEKPESRHQSYKESDERLTVNITQNQTANPVITNTASQHNEQSSTLTSNISINIQLKDFSSDMKSWSQDLFEDLLEDEDLISDNDTAKLLKRSQKEIERLSVPLDEIEDVENKEEATSKSDNFSRVKNFLEDALDKTNKTGELLDKTGEGIKKLQSLASKYNKVAELCAMPTVPSFLLG
ncbi:GTP-binding protein [Pseudoalteromonas sp. SWYJ118]|uniref:COR domain-containing protein n=1 Tax=Pseudoalteromonas sp. SWYJ118 TaxID=2792062 RepID=UPI0018CD7103|nr:COR domain-containing protein [Pseudoalteromonas sp. SWYJ118]MBH0075235.1 GTP-binding protein [Pseudoalteromonas sp. SWYJ118]